MKKRQREEDTNEHTQFDPRQTMRKTPNGCARNEVKIGEEDGRREDEHGREEDGGVKKQEGGWREEVE